MWPWIDTIELYEDTKDAATASSLMLKLFLHVLTWQESFVG